MTQRLIQIRDLSDDALATRILECIKPALLRNAPKIKGGAVESDFLVSFCMQVQVDLSNPESIGISAKGYVEPALFEPVRVKQAWGA